MIHPRSILVLLFGLLAVPLSAQLPQASATALGMGFNTTASSRGFAAIANNPAGLAGEDAPGFSLAIPALAVEVGFGPVTLSDLSPWEGQLVPASVKDQWLEAVVASGAQSGSFAAGATPVAFTLGSLGFQLSTQVAGRVDLRPDAVQLLLFGNAGRTGEAEDLDLRGSSLDGYLLSTAALGWGFRAGDRLILGVTGKYTVGSGLVVGRDAGSVLRSDPLSAEIRFPVLYPGEGDFVFDRGSGVGLDLGAIWTGRAVTVGATIQNALNTFEWDVEGMTFIPGQALFEQGSSQSDFQERPATDAPADLLAAAEELTLKPVYGIGVELRPGSILRLTGDLRKRASGGLVTGPDFHAGVGAELRILPVLPLRAHLAAVSGGVQVGGGASLVLGPLNLSGALALRTRDTGDSTLGMVTLSFGGS